MVKSEWRVAYNPMLMPTPYSVYRLKNRYGINHSGNREMLPEMYETRSEAEAKAAELNRRRGEDD